MQASSSILLTTAFYSHSYSLSISPPVFRACDIVQILKGILKRERKKEIQKINEQGHKEKSEQIYYTELRMCLL